MTVPSPSSTVVSPVGPRRGLRVLEVSEGIAGAVCGRLFAGLGHDVIRVAADKDDALRIRPPLNADGVSLHHTTLHAGKRVARPPATSGTQAHDLLEAADVLVLDIAPSRAEELGLGPDSLHARWPELVVVWITGFGADTELSELPSSSLLAESYGGLATMIGEAGRRPLTLGGEQTEHCGAVVGFLGAMLALLRRDQGAGGDLVDVALCDVAAYMDWKSDVSFFMTGRSPARAVRDEGDWRLVRASDGWVGFIFLPRHWPGVVELIDDPALRATDLAEEAVRHAQPERWWPVVERWAAALPAAEIYTRAQALGLPFGWVVRVSDLLHSEQLRSRGFVNPDLAMASGRAPAFGAPLGSALPWTNEPAVPIDTVAWQPRAAGSRGPHPSLTGDAQRPLAGITVLDFGTITAGAAVTRLLADHGAQILKVEWADRPDTFRTWKLPEAQTRADDSLVSPYFPSNNVGKLDVAIDLKSPAGRAVVRRLAAHSDVVVENFRVGVTRRLGIDVETLHEASPELVYLSLSSQGQHGPEADNRSFGSTLDLLSGLAALTGYPDSGPMWSSYEVNYPDQLVSLVGAAAVVYCLHQGIRGTVLDVSQREVVSWTLAVEAADYVVNARNSTVTGNARAGYAPHDTYPAANEQWLAVSCASWQQRRALAEWLGRADLDAADEQWWSGREAYRIVAAATGDRDRAEAVAALRAAGVPAVPVLTAADRAQTPRFGKRRVVLTGDGPPVKGFPMVFGRYEPAPPTSAPAIGEHTVAVLTGVAGLTGQELARLEADDAIRSSGTGSRRGEADE